jgi:acyl transferase domain-containing protein/NADP-dependent 3-hydroxy acid dehydrogenase YdfG/aryl carrier-like protein
VADNPIALIGMACRLPPHIDSPDEFWELLTDGRDSVREVPPERWEPYLAGDPETSAVVRGATRFGAFRDDVAGFDAAFFGISPREAMSLDPQQRMFLELAWEALESAGIPPLALRGTGTGVFAAANSHDYGDRLMADLPRLEAWAVNGSYAFGIANRVSYTLDTHGPSMAVDTACAGSLTALHLACQHLWRGETDLAIVGGVNVMAAPGILIALDASGATAPDGRSKAFDKAADGYGRGEGAGVVVLKRLPDADRDGNRVLARILGGGTRHDGAGDGMMAPNGAAQEDMLRLVYARSGVPPESIDYVEAHGTGTRAGDAAEAAALSRFFGAGRGRNGHEPCLIGSVKPNIGHLEAAAGIAGLIKVVLAMRHGALPPSPHRELTPAVDWDRAGLQVVAALTPWPDRGRPRRAGISSFGVGGTISHVIVEEGDPPVPPARHETEPRPRLFPLSSMSADGVAAQAATLAGWLDKHPDAPLSRVAATLSRHRSHLSFRRTVVASDTAGLAARLREDGPPAGPAGAAADPVWVFSGHGAQWTGMGRELLREEPVFAQTMKDLEPIYRTSIGFTPREAILDGEWSDVGRVQAMTFAMQIGLAEVWRALGVRPGAVIGHSVGEISAAVVAGALDRDEAAAFACHRAAVVRRGAGLGGMAMVALPFDEVAERLAGRADVVPAIAASPSWTVISGSVAGLAEVTGKWSGDGVVIRRVDTDVPFHSGYMDPLLADVAAAAGSLTVRAPQVPLYSTVTADPRAPAPRDGGYWSAMLREPVRFTAAVQAASDDGHRIFTEISTHPIVTHSIDDILGGDAVVSHSLRRGEPELATLLAGLGTVHEAGGRVDWSRLHPDGEPIDLPPTAWQHRRFWPQAPPGRSAGLSGGGHDPASHTLLGAASTVSTATPSRVWQTHLDVGSRPYPGRHPVRGVEIVPAAVLLGTFLAAADGAGLRDVRLRVPVALDPPRLLQVVSQDGTLRLASRGADGGADEWLTHCTASVADASALASLATDLYPGSSSDWAGFADELRRRGVGGYGFDWEVRDLRLADGRLDCEVIAGPSATWAPVLDGALTVMSALLPGDQLRMPARIAAVTVRGTPPEAAVVRARVHDGLIDVTVRAADVGADVLGLEFAPVDGAPGAVTPPRLLVHELAWRPLPSAGDGDGDDGDGDDGDGGDGGDDDDGDGDGDGGRAGPPLPGPVVFASDDFGYLAALEHAGVRCLPAGTPGRAAELAAEAGAGLVVTVATPGPGWPRATGRAPGSGAAPGPGVAAEHNAWSLIRTAQVLAGLPAPPRLACLATAGELSHAPLRGIARIAAGELPDLWGGLIEVSPELAGTVAAGTRLRPLLAAAWAGAAEELVALTAEGDLVPRLVPVDRPPGRPPSECHSDGTYLITGGLGALGVEVARWLASRGARRLVLAGRRGLPPRRDWNRTGDARVAAVRAIEKLGTSVHALPVDIADAERVKAALDQLDLPPVRGVVHAAGVLRDARLTATRSEDLAEVMRPKVDGAMVLHELFPPGTLDFFVLFSSSGQFARVTGQAGYAAANSFLDALAEVRGDAISLGWMAWQGLGMAGSNTAGMAEANARGLDGISMEEALSAWRYAERAGGGYFAIARAVASPARPPVLSELLTDTDGAASAGTAEEPVATTPEELAEDLRTQVAAELRMSPAEIGLGRPLPELGVDSVLLVTLRARVLRRYGVDLPQTILWNQPTIRALATHLSETLEQQ